jgi:hypothetical protein
MVSVVVVVVQNFEYFVPENQLIVVIEFPQIECLVDFAMMELVLDYFDFEDLDEECEQTKKQWRNIQTLLKSYI